MSDNTEVQAEGPSLGIVDIQNALKIIDFASEQGAFKGWSTIKQVMSVRDKFEAFVAFAAANDAASAEETAPAESDQASA